MVLCYFSIRFALFWHIYRPEYDHFQILFSRQRLDKRPNDNQKYEIEINYDKPIVCTLYICSFIVCHTLF